MTAPDLTAGQRLIEALKEALAFARGEANGCVVHEVLTADGKPQVLPADRIEAASAAAKIDSEDRQ